MTDHDEILADKQKAQEHAREYLNVVLRNINAASRLLSTAMEKFTRFVVDLPEAKATAFRETASEVIDTDVPAFRFMRMLPEHERAIDKAALGLAAAGDWRAKLKDQTAPPDGIIPELIEASQKAPVVWAKTLHLIDLEADKRLSHLDHHAPESIVAKLQRLLSLPVYPTEAELDQIESACLWKMIHDWVSANVFWLETIIMVPKIDERDKFIRAGTETTLEGINNNQVATIAALFGPGVPRGKYFNAPAITYGWNALDYWGVSTRYRKVYRSQAAAGQM
jgi:hypothetical protein